MKVKTSGKHAVWEKVGTQRCHAQCCSVSIEILRLVLSPTIFPFCIFNKHFYGHQCSLYCLFINISACWGFMCAIYSCIHGGSGKQQSPNLLSTGVCLHPTLFSSEAFVKMEFKDFFLTSFLTSFTQMLSSCKECQNIHFLFSALFRVFSAFISFFGQVTHCHRT